MIGNIDTGSLESLLMVGSQPFFVVIVGPLFPHHYVASNEHKYARSVDCPVSYNYELPSLVWSPLFMPDETKVRHNDQREPR